jgi:hypothetical protein
MSLLSRFESGSLQAAEASEFLGAFDVSCTACAASFSLGEPIRIASITNAPANTIDPAEAERFINSLWPGNTLLGRTLFAKSDQISEALS